MNLPKQIAGLSIAALLCACAPERGTVAWCEQMDETPKGQWSMDDASEYAQSCILRGSERD